MMKTWTNYEFKKRRKFLQKTLELERWSPPHNFLHISFTKMTKISYFSYENVNLALISTQNKWRNNVYSDICLWYKDMLLQSDIWKKNEPFWDKISCIIYYQQIVRRWHHQLSHLNIHKDWSRNVFRKNVKFQNVTTSLFHVSDFHHFWHQSVGKLSLLQFLWNYAVISGLRLPL